MRNLQVKNKIRSNKIQRRCHTDADIDIDIDIDFDEIIHSVKCNQINTMQYNTMIVVI